MEKYKKPRMEIVELSREDVIVTSGGSVGGCAGNIFGYSGGDSSSGSSCGGDGGGR